MISKINGCNLSQYIHFLNVIHSNYSEYHIVEKIENNYHEFYNAFTQELIFKIVFENNIVYLMIKDNKNKFEKIELKFNRKKIKNLIDNNIKKYGVILKTNSFIDVLPNERNYRYYICNKCNNNIRRKPIVMINNQNIKCLEKIYFCFTCNDYYITEKELNDFTLKYSKRYVFKNDNMLAREVDFLVKSNDFKCLKNKHKVNNIKARINVLIEGEIKECEVDGFYCINCNKYYIMESEYELLRRKGLILCKIYEEKTIASSNSYGFNLNTESILHSYGYNVGQQNNLSDRDRQKIISFLLENNIMNKHEMKNHLNYLINRSKNNKKMDIAINKWKNDIDYISRYDVSTGISLKAKSLKIKIYTNS